MEDNNKDDISAREFSQEHPTKSALTNRTQTQTKPYQITNYKLQMSFNENKKTISKTTSSIKDNMKLRMIKILLYKSLYLKQKTISKGTYFIKSGNDPFTSEWGLPSIQQTNMYTN